MENHPTGAGEHHHSSSDGTGYYQLHGPRTNRILSEVKSEKYASALITHRERTDRSASPLFIYYVCCAIPYVTTESMDSKSKIRL